MIIEIFNSMNKYQRAIYETKLDWSHIIVTGHVTYTDFCREFFLADDDASVAILDSGTPDLQPRRLLNHPFYGSRLIFLQGDQLLIQDLNRAQTKFATGMFILTSEKVANTEDKAIGA